MSSSRPTPARRLNACRPNAHRSTALLPAPPGPALRRVAGRTAALTVLVAGSSLVATSAASAHVRVQADSTASGSYSALTFRVPNESSTTGTVRVQVELPQDRPFLSVSTRPVPGWTVAMAKAALPAPVDVDGTTLTEAARTVTWTADRGVMIEPGQYQEFSLSVGPLPAPGTVLLPTEQTYDDGTVVAWDQPTPASGEEPEDPAPTLVVTAAGADEHGGSTSSTDASATAGPGADPVARALGVGALALGAAGLVLAALGLRRRRPGTGA